MKVYNLQWQTGNLNRVGSLYTKPWSTEQALHHHSFGCLSFPEFLMFQLDDIPQRQHQIMEPRKNNHLTGDNLACPHPHGRFPRHHEIRWVATGDSENEMASVRIGLTERGIRHRRPPATNEGKGASAWGGFFFVPSRRPRRRLISPLATWEFGKNFSSTFFAKRQAQCTG